MADPYIGEIRMAAFPFAPKGFALCDGQLLPIAQNQALYSLLGTMYGGDGRTTFALPDLRGRVPIHWGTGSQATYAVGQAGGQANHTLSLAETPGHTHSLTGATAPAAAQRGPAGNYFGPAQQSGAGFNLYAGGSPAVTLNPGVVSTTGSGQAHNNLQPYQVVNFYIALQGIFPSRN